MEQRKSDSMTRQEVITTIQQPLQDRWGYTVHETADKIVLRNSKGELAGEIFGQPLTLSRRYVGQRVVMGSLIRQHIRELLPHITVIN